MGKKEEEKQEEQKAQELDLDNLDQVTGGGAFSEIPRVPTKSYEPTVTKRG